MFWRKRKVIKRRKPSARYVKDKEAARKLIHERLAYWNTFYNYSYGRVSIKDTKSRWGSCSKKGNLNFSYKLIHIPPDLADYVVVHELCHLGEFNHSQKFWNLIARTTPDYKERRNRLLKIRL